MAITPLGKVREILSGFAWSASKFNHEGRGTPIIRIQNVDAILDNDFVFWEEPYDERFVIRRGDLLLTLSGSFRIESWNGPDALLNQRIVKLTPAEGLDRGWLLHVLRHRLIYIERLGKHALVNNVSIEDIRNLKIPLPPLSEQRRIAAILDKADELRAKRRAALAKLDSLTQGIFLDMFGDPATNPERWPIKTLAEFYVNKEEGTKCGPFGSALKKDEFESEGVPVWNMDNIDAAGRMVLPFRMWISESKYRQLESYAVVDGDVIVSRAGTVGKMCVVSTGGAKSIISTNLIRLRFGPGLLPQYFVSLMTYSKGRVGRLKTGADGTLTHMNTGILDTLKLPYPPVEKQGRFVVIVESIERQKSRYATHLAEIDMLFTTIQHRAFRGEL
ncbi:MAG: restriction endonuclease subunit S [Nitrospira sp.]